MPAELGSKENPYLIASADDLDAVRSHPAAYHKMTANIDLDIAPYNAEQGWIPIKGFSGNFDGAGFVIKNIRINDSTLVEAGFFANLQDEAKIHDLGIIHANINAKSKVGILTGSGANKIRIERCYTSGSVSGENYVGGFIGASLLTEDAKLEDCHTNADLKIVDDDCGGFIGKVTALPGKTNSIESSYFNGTLSGGNLITTGPVYGRCTNLVCKDIYYDSEKNSHSCDHDGVTPLTTEQFLDEKNFYGLHYRYFLDHARWKFIPKNPPKLWHEDNESILLFFNEAFHIYDFDKEEWKIVTKSKPLSVADIEKGMPSLSGIPIEAFKELEKFGQVTVYCYIEDLDEGTATKRQVEALFDVERTKKEIILCKHMEKNIKKSADADSVTCSLAITQDTKSPYEKYNVEISCEKEKNIAKDALAKNGLNTKQDVVITSDAVVEDTSTSKDVYVKKVEKVQSSDSADEYIGFADTHRELHILSSSAKGYKGLNLNISSEKEKTVAANQLSEKSGLVKKKNFLIDTDTKKETTGINPGQISYIFNTTTDVRDRQLRMDMKSAVKSRYLLTVNNGAQWLTYDSTSKTWIESALSDVHAKGVTKEQMADPEIWKSFPSTYRSKIKCAVGIRSEAFSAEHHVRGMDIDFEPNEGPEIIKDNLTIKDDLVRISGVLNDKENDDVEYKILTQPFGEKEWTQIMPTPTGSYHRPNGYRFDHTFELSNFRSGDNTIRIESKDARGVSYHKDYQLILVTGEPIIKMNKQNEFYLNTTIDHSLGKKVRFKILINGKQISPRRGYTDWKQPPFNFEYTWKSDDLQYGMPNKMTVVAVDELGTESQTEFVVDGGYKGLLFRDENNLYYSTDKGEILQQLDFGTVIGGQLKEPHIIYLENRTGLELENVTVYIDPKQQEEHIKLRLSELEKPFTSVERFTYKDKMPHGSVKAFYARIETDIEMKSIKNKVFNIYAKGEPVID